MQSVNDIRKHFLDYFQRAEHEVVSSSSLVPQNDPTLMFTNAGMVQFKNIFTGNDKVPYQRATTSQKCVRAGGKHNDLDNVGYTARHHTFFEMLGNFSFGDYFKEYAIELAWKLITNEFELNPKKLLITVYSEDEVAFNLWKKIAHLPEERIIRISTSDNFWSMGDTGPCGPCSEIFYDHGSHVAGGPPGSRNQEGDRFVEIWNLVFMQYEQITTGERIDLPRQSIDTGMGLERIAAILQGKHDNYETNLFQNLIAASVELTNMPAEGEHKASHRVVADHLRASSFLIADGVMPANEGRGYVLRRIMRRAMRYAHLMGCKEPLMFRLVPYLVKEMGSAFPELVRAQALIIETLKLEEEKFSRTLVRGLRLLGDAVNNLEKHEPLSGKVAFQLYDTYGFPLDLTEDALRRQGLGVDKVGFDKAMEQQRTEARKSWVGSGDKHSDSFWSDLYHNIGSTEFLGYEIESVEAVIQAIVKDGKHIESLDDGETCCIVVNQTPFYGEAGGQVGDKGKILSADGTMFTVDDTKIFSGGLIIHIGHSEGGNFNLGDAVILEIDKTRRASLRRNHSATHLLHAALRNNLGNHVTQKGSLVAPDKLRFDISHSKPITKNEKNTIESEVNATIRANLKLSTHLMTPEHAVETGAMALFGEKYGEEVRVVSVNQNGNTTQGSTDKFYSSELCGGTHVNRTGDIGMFTLISDSAVGSGVRRVEALTGETARLYVSNQSTLLNEASAVAKTTPPDLTFRITALMEERKLLERELSELRKKQVIAGENQQLITKNVCGISFIGQCLNGIPTKDMKSMIDSLKKRLGSGVCAVVSVTEGKAVLVVGITDDLTDRINAVNLVREGAIVVGGKGGGGRPDMAQAGGPNGALAEDALKTIENVLARELSK